MELTKGKRQQGDTEIETLDKRTLERTLEGSLRRC